MGKISTAGVMLAFCCLPVTALAAGDGVVEIIRTPLVEWLLAAVIFVSLAAEIKTAGFSGGSLLAALAGCLLIGANWYAGEETTLEFVLYFGGMALILLDILVVMSGALAAAGLVVLLSGLFLTFGGNAPALYILAASIVLACVAGYFLLRRLSSSRLWQRLTLHNRLTGKEGYVSSSQNLSAYVGKTGTALSVLRPSGKVEIEGHILDAVSAGGFIEKGCTVTVMEAAGSHVIVKEK